MAEVRGIQASPQCWPATSTQPSPSLMSCVIDVCSTPKLGLIRIGSAAHCCLFHTNDHPQHEQHRSRIGHHVRAVRLSDLHVFIRGCAQQILYALTAEHMYNDWIGCVAGAVLYLCGKYRVLDH